MSEINLNNKEFVLDFSSFFCIYEVCKKLKFTPQHKFIISNAIKDLIVHKIQEVQNSPDEKHALDIDFKGIRLITFEEGYKTKQIEHLQDMILWIEQYCSAEIVVERLDELRKLDDYSDNKSLFEYIADYIHIANKSNRILITDDLILHRSKIGISSQWYLKTFFEESVINTELLRRNYIGVPIDKDFLKNEFINKISGKENTYYKSLDSLCYLLPSNKNTVINTICSFLKDVYTDTLVIEDINRETVSFFTRILKSITDAGTLVILGRCLHKEFRLLGLKQITVMQNYFLSLRIVFPDLVQPN